MKKSLITIISLLLGSLALNAQNTVKDHEALFTSMDKDADSRITKEEFWGLWNNFFTFRDKDKDKELTFEEYFLAKSDGNKVVFERLDIDKDGQVTVDEEKAFRMNHFKVLDADKDNNLDIEEMSVGAKE